MGVVDEALDVQRNVHVAMKRLPHIRLAALYQFKKEFRSLANISHPNLVTLYELAAEGDEWFFTMELVEGENFHNWVRPGSESPGGDTTTATALTLELTGREEHAATMSQPRGICHVGRLREALVQLAKATAHLHSHGIVHRDLKPGNVMVAPDGRVVVLDFGLAEEAAPRDEDKLAFDGIVGTIPYMSPEQGDGKNVGTASDWYSTGVMLYEALTGQFPFRGSLYEVIRAKQRGDPPPPDSLMPSIPTDLSDLCMGLLRRDPDMRFGASHILALAGEPAATIMPGPFELVSERLFVGRASELAALRDSFAAARRATAIARVHGGSGMGKSALVQQFLRDVRDLPEAVVLQGRCYEQESVPYKAFDSVIDSLARYLVRIPAAEVAQLVPPDVVALARVFPVLRRVQTVAEAPSRQLEGIEPRDLRRLAFGTLRSLLARLGKSHRLILWMDDLQWADPDSAALMREILRAPDPPILLLIASHRDGMEEQSVFLETAFADVPGDVCDIPVGPLTRADTIELAARLSGDEGAQAEKLAEESGGNPYFIQELSASPGVRAEGGEATLDSMLWRRVGRLPTESRQLLETIAVAGQPVTEKEACQAAGMDKQDPKIFAMLRSARMIRGLATGDAEGGDIAEVETWHDRVRETVLGRLPFDTRRVRHAGLAAALEAAGRADAERVAFHYEGAGDTRKAGVHYLAAGHAADAALAFKQAAEFFQKALDLSTPEGAERQALTVSLANALANAGRGFEAAQNFEAASHETSGAELFELERKAAYWFTASGHVDEGRDAFRNMLRRVDLRLHRSPLRSLFSLVGVELWLRLRGLRIRPRSDHSIASDVLERIDVAWDASEGLIAVDIMNGALFASRCLLLALEAGDANRAVRSLLVQAGMSTVFAFGRPRRKLILGEIHRLLPLVTDPEVLNRIPLTEGTAELFLGHYDVALAKLDESRRVLASQPRGAMRGLSTTELFRHMSLISLNLYREALASGIPICDEAAERGDLFLASSLGGVLAGARLAVEGPEAALQGLNASLARWTHSDYHTLHVVAALTRCHIFLYMGDGESAMTLLQREWKAMKKGLFLRTEWFWQWIRFSRAQSALCVAATVAAPERLLREAERDAARIERDGLEWSGYLPRLIRAGCAACRGDRNDALKLFDRAVGECAAAGAPAVAEAVQYRRGMLAEDRAAMERATAALHEHGVGNAERFSAIYVNGLASTEPQ